MDPNYENLLNELRSPLKEYGVNADDLGMKTLNKCKPILAAIEAIKAERKAAEDRLLSLEISFNSIADRTGIDRKSLAENEIYRRLILSAKTAREERVDKRIKTLSLELEQYKRMEADVEATIQRQMDLNRKYAVAETEKVNLQQEYEIIQKRLDEANKTIGELQKENMNLNRVISQNRLTYNKNNIN